VLAEAVLEDSSVEGGWLAEPALGGTAVSRGRRSPVWSIQCTLRLIHLGLEDVNKSNTREVWGALLEQNDPIQNDSAVRAFQILHLVYQPGNTYTYTPR
jgi:hypothetical protein